MLERMIIYLGIVFGFFSFPTLFKRPSAKVWLPLYLINCLINFVFDKALVESKQVKYPVRLLPRLFKINFVYDFFVCPFLSIWYCQSTYKSNLRGILGKLFVFGVPQAIYEVMLERKTDNLKFLGNWKWIYSFLLVFVVKAISRVALEFFKKAYEKPSSDSN